MISIDSLKDFGANTEEGLARCMGMEDFYLKLVGMVLSDPNFDKLERSVDAGDVTEAFEAAHALKGVLGNLSLTPLYSPASEITEKLRNQTEMVDISDLYAEYKEALERFRALAE